MCCKDGGPAAASSFSTGAFCHAATLVLKGQSPIFHTKTQQQQHFSTTGKRQHHTKMREGAIYAVQLVAANDSALIQPPGSSGRVCEGITPITEWVRPPKCLFLTCCLSARRYGLGWCPPLLEMLQGCFSTPLKWDYYPSDSKTFQHISSTLDFTPFTS